jgi:plasmid stabilization system protein ParE
VKLRFTPTARVQFKNAVLYIHKDKPAAAKRFRDKAETVLRRVAEFPDSGRRLPEVPDLPYREVIVSPYRFFYRLEGETIWVVAVWHSAQLPTRPTTP